MSNQIRQLVKWTAAAADTLRRPSGLVILIYHRVGARTPVSVDLPRPLFAQQLAALAADWSPVTLDEAAELLSSRTAPSGLPPVCLTFDDGTADFVDEALPELVMHRIPATLYVATDHIEVGRPFPDDGRPVSWAGLRDALSTGFVTIGSHTHTHRLLDRVDTREAAAELDRSTGLIEERLGIACHHFAYPKALLGSPAAEAEVRRRFRTAAIARTRPNPYGATDLHRLHRSPVQVGDGLRWFRRKALGGMGLEDDLPRPPQPAALQRRSNVTPLPVVLVGGGGHASDVLQAIEMINCARSSYRVVGILADGEVDSRRFVGRDVAHIGPIEAVSTVGAAYVLCLGWPWIRHDVARRIGESAEPAPPIIHPSADIGAGVELGPGCVVLGHAHLSPFVRLGAHSLVSYNATIGHDTTFGEHASVMPNAAVSGDVVAGQRVLVGTGAVVREGVRLGDDVRIGAGAAVIRDVDSARTVIGVPARPIDADGPQGGMA